MVSAKNPNAADLKQLFQEAADIAGVVPESMHVAAFQRAVDELMAVKGYAPQVASQPADLRRQTPARRPAGSSASAKPEAIAAGDVVANLIESIDRTKYEITAAMKVRERSMRVLQIARDAHNVDGLTPSEISTILTEKFRVATTRAAVNMAIGGERRFLDRTKVGSGYKYRLMAAGDEHLRTTPNSESPKSSAPVNPRRNRTALKSAKKSPATHASAKSTTSSSVERTRSKRGTSSRKSPSQLIDQLLSAGFFSQPRLIGEVIGHARTQLGHTYKPNDLSPTLVRSLRQGKLARRKNDQGQYEYTAGKPA